MLILRPLGFLNIDKPVEFVNTDSPVECLNTDKPAEFVNTDNPADHANNENGDPKIQGHNIYFDTIEATPLMPLPSGEHQDISSVLDLPSIQLL